MPAPPRPSVRRAATTSVEGSLTLAELRAIVDETADWPSESRVSLREYNSYPGEPGSTPDQITIHRN